MTPPKNGENDGRLCRQSVNRDDGHGECARWILIVWCAPPIRATTRDRRHGERAAMLRTARSGKPIRQPWPPFLQELCAAQMRMAACFSWSCSRDSEGGELGSEISESRRHSMPARLALSNRSSPPTLMVKRPRFPERTDKSRSDLKRQRHRRADGNRDLDSRVDPDFPLRAFVRCESCGRVFTTATRSGESSLRFEMALRESAPEACRTLGGAVAVRETVSTVICMPVSVVVMRAAHRSNSIINWKRPAQRCAAQCSCR